LFGSDDPILKQALASKRHVFVKGALSADELPSWQDVLDDLSLNFTENAPTSPINVLEDLGFVTYRGNRLPKVEQIRQVVARFDARLPCSAHLYISLTSFSKTFGRHKDNTDVFYIQALGKTHWTIDDSGIHEYDLGVGDLLFIPAEMYHASQPLSPRVGLSVGLDHGTAP
jgi:hypothetical protein